MDLASRLPQVREVEHDGRDVLVHVSADERMMDNRIPGQFLEQTVHYCPLVGGDSGLRQDRGDRQPNRALAIDDSIVQ